MMIHDSIIIGAGQAGLGLSYFLQQKSLKHIVLERGRIGESWLSQRWDSFKLNTMNIINTLPGLPYKGNEPDGFWSSADLTEYFKQYAGHFQLPVRTGTAVLSVEQDKADRKFIVRTQSNGHSDEQLLSRSVVIACGMQQTPKYPAIHSRMPHNIKLLHTADYRNPAQLPEGAIVIVGSGQSGCQITEDLLAAGRKVYLCTSKVPRVPRRYRGKDILEWMMDLKMLDVTLESLEDKAVSRIPQPQTSGLGRYGHTISLQQLARQGAVILGRLTGIEENTLILSDEARAHVIFADQFSQGIKDQIDAYLMKNDISQVRAEDDPADNPDPQASCASPLRRLDLKTQKVSTVIWATGFTGDFSWLQLPVLDSEGLPVHQRGISALRGLYFLGFPWLNSRKSGVIYGIEEDARYLAAAITEHIH